MVEIKSIYTSSFIKGPNDAAADLIGRIQIELVNWKHRRPLKDILSEIEERTADLPGIIIETQKKEAGPGGDRKSTRLNSSHVRISYAVFCLKKKKKQKQ